LIKYWRYYTIYII